MPKLAALHVASCIASVSVLSIGVALLVAPAASAEAQVLTFLSPVPEKDGTINYAVGPEVDLRLPFTATENGALEIRVLPFTGERGDVLLVEPSIAEQPSLGVKERVVSFSMDQPILTLRLKGPGLPAPTKYTGVIFARQGKTQQTNRVVLTLAPALRPAKVAVDPKSVTIYQTGRSRRATFKVQALNTSADWQADGVFLRLLEVTAPPGTNFDPASNLKLTWNGKETTDLWRSPNADSAPRSILPNRQADIGGELVRVSPGEYTVKVGLGAANAVVEGDQSITMKLYVKHGLGWPIAVLLLAIGVSWFSTKGLEAQRRRVTQLKKIGDIRQDGMQEEPAPLPAVAARAILKQAQDRNRSWFGALFGQDTTGARLDKAELLLGILARVRTIQSRIKSAAWGLLPRNRANKELARITGSLNPATVDENAVKKLEADLDALDRWFDTAQFDEQYWLNLKKEMAGLLSYVEPANFAHHEHEPLVTRLRNEIEAAVAGQPPAGQQPAGQQTVWQPKGREISRVEESYAKLKILWERNQEDDKDTLLKLGDELNRNQNMSIEAFFRLADGAAWLKLKDAEFEFVTPVPNQVDPPSGYQLIRFQIAPKVRSLGQNYLFKHKIEYTWKLEFKRKATWWVAVWNFIFRKSEKWLPLTQARTNEPHVVQYVPDQGTLSMSVRLNYDGESQTKEIKLKELEVQRSSEYGWLSAFQTNEVLAVLIAAAAALLSGLMTYYLNKPSFGSLADYITLFIWGAGADQTKNFIQNLERVSGKP